jgi:transcriptional regulator with XRE-family HTH domain
MQRGWVVSPDYRAAISALKDTRTELGISQRELARRLGKPPSFVNKIEQVERRLDFLEFIAIAKAMELKASDLLERLRSILPEIVAL